MLQECDAKNHNLYISSKDEYCLVLLTKQVDIRKYGGIWHLKKVKRDDIIGKSWDINQFAPLHWKFKDGCTNFEIIYWCTQDLPSVAEK